MEDLRARRRTVAVVALVGVTMVWGSTFVVVKDAIGRMPTMDFLAIRFALAAVVMAAVRPSALRRLDRTTLGHGVVLGLVLGLSYIAQTVGLETTAAAVSGFITGLFVVLTPIFGAVLLRTRLRPIVWVAVALATAGLALISLRGTHVGTGEGLTLLCAVGFALHIVGLSRWAPGSDLWPLTVLQMLTAATLCAVAAAPGGITAPPDPESWGALALTGVLATAVAYAIQTWAQRWLAASQVAIVLTLEPVFAGIFAVLFADQAVTFGLVAGGVAIVSAMYLAELHPSKLTTGVALRDF
jgi:drug/metabolite transporter (DMT)-like permease